MLLEVSGYSDLLASVPFPFSHPRRCLPDSSYFDGTCCGPRDISRKSPKSVIRITAGSAVWKLDLPASVLLRWQCKRQLFDLLPPLHLNGGLLLPVANSPYFDPVSGPRYIGEAWSSGVIPGIAIDCPGVQGLGDSMGAEKPGTTAIYRLRHIHNTLHLSTKDPQPFTTLSRPHRRQHCPICRSAHT